MFLRTSLLLLTVIGGPALACSPAVSTPSDVPQRGENCELSYQVSEIDTVGLGQARDLGNGLVIQSAFEGNGCFGETSMIVTDCATGRAKVLGTYTWSLDGYEAPPSKLERMVAKVEAAVTGGGTDVLDRAEAAARQAGFNDVLDLRSSDRIKVQGKLLGLTCACKSFYPGLKPGA
ncbi:hypothetical protein ACSBLW_02845 [Thioclava sp. FR2]|uniref:hypothetical protein n=1 Tax=Thioclava sp. FR2 TaxID=3445780 RepID=UPI003EB6F797